MSNDLFLLSVVAIPSVTTVSVTVFLVPRRHYRPIQIAFQDFMVVHAHVVSPMCREGLDASGLPLSDR